MKRKVYLSGKISNLPMEQVAEKFNEAEAWLTMRGYEVVNPIKLDHSENVSQSWVKYMKVDIKALMDCDLIAFLPCWVTSPGAILEFQLAKHLEYDVIFINENWVLSYGT